MKRRSFLQGLAALLPLSLLGGKNPEPMDGRIDMEVYGRSPMGEALVDAKDLSAIMNDPTGAYGQAFARAAGKRMDDEIIAAFNADQWGKRSFNET